MLGTTKIGRFSTSKGPARHYDCLCLLIRLRTVCCDDKSTSSDMHQVRKGERGAHMEALDRNQRVSIDRRGGSERGYYGRPTTSRSSLFSFPCYQQMMVHRTISCPGSVLPAFTGPSDWRKGTVGLARNAISARWARCKTGSWSGTQKSGEQDDPAQCMLAPEQLV